MESQLCQELQQLSPEQLRKLLSASGHGELLRNDNDTYVVDEKLVTELKSEGNTFFRQGRIHDAVSAYSRCIDLDPKNAVCHSNRAAAYLKLNYFDHAITDCSKAIAIAPTIKPFMRRATAHIGLKQFCQAVDDLTAALELEPRNKECFAKLQAIVEIATSVPGSDNNINQELRKASARALAIVSLRQGWSIIAVRGNPAPSAVNGHTLFTGSDGRIYLFGGRAVREQKPQVFVRDERDNTSWSLVPICGLGAPLSCAWHSTSSIGSKARDIFCVYGGVSSRGEDSCVHLLVPSSPRGFQWRQVHCMQDPTTIPVPRSGHAAVSIGECNDQQAVFIFGGRTKRGVSNQLHVLRLHTGNSESDASGLEDMTISWTEISTRDQANSVSWPSARDGHSMCLLQSEANTAPRLIVFGGNGQLNDDKKNDVWIFDVEKQFWRFLQCSGDIPPPRSYHTAHAVGEFLFIVCGRTAAFEDDSIFMLDIEEALWYKLPVPCDQSFSPRAWHSSVLTKAGKLFVLGGGTYHGPLKKAAELDLSYFCLKAPMVTCKRRG